MSQSAGGQARVQAVDMQRPGQKRPGSGWWGESVMWRRRFSPGRMAGDALRMVVRVAVRVAVRVVDAPRLVICAGEYSAGRRGAQMAKMAVTVP